MQAAMSTGGLLSRLRARVGASLQFHTSKILCQQARAKPFACKLDQGIISFTFDDFPRSAYEQGGKILQRHGARATFYVAGGAMQAELAAAPRLLSEVVDAGHELGCHTYEHLDCVATGLPALDADLERNARLLAPVIGQPRPAHFAYPYGRMSLRAKRALSQRFVTCRGIFPGINSSPVDLAVLKANKLYGGSRNLARARRLIGQAARSGGWLIFFTHDVTEGPSPYGCSIKDFQEIVELAVSSPCSVLPVGTALASLGFGGEG
jgi:peptidoglycan/xylan/chitin deacetylase (PgdA/CDA1 family)